MDENSINLIKEEIYSIRGYYVILDSELAELYRVETKVLNQAVVRNKDRFPDDFSFRLTNEEWSAIRSQFVTLKPGGRGKHKKYAPRVFTEHGVLMASTILRSQEAVAMSTFIVRAFVKMREELSSNQEILKRLAEIDHTLLTHDSALRDLYHKLLPLIDPPPESPRRILGFHQKDAEI